MEIRNRAGIQSLFLTRGSILSLSWEAHGKRDGCGPHRALKSRTTHAVVSVRHANESAPFLLCGASFDVSCLLGLKQTRYALKKQPLASV